MSFEFNLPNFQVSTPEMRQMHSYLYQTIQQLNWAMKNIQTAEGSANLNLPVRKPSGGGSSTEKTPVESFAEIKSLIIKSADIINAYYDSISAKLEGVYVAQSEFGEFVEYTALELEGNSQGIQQNYTNIQGIQVDVSYLEKDIEGVQTEVSGFQTILDGTQADVFDLQANVGGIRGDVGNIQGEVSGLSGKVDGVEQDVSNVRDSVSGVQNGLSKVEGEVDGLQQNLGNIQTIIVETNAYIRTGQIDTDEYGIPIYGLEIGQTNSVNGQTAFDKFARFAADRLSFYDRNDVEVAYISDYKLYITNAEITGSLQLAGKFKIYYNGGLAFQWIGGGS